MEKNPRKAILIDASGKKLGRVASLAASTLMGKDTTAFARNIFPERIVKIQNIARLDLSARRINTLTKVSYSGYPGGIRVRGGQELVEKKGVAHLLSNAVRGMLPKNKLRDRMMKNLVIET